MDHEVAFIRIGFCENNLVPLAGFAEVDDVSQILFRRRRDIAVRRSKRVQLQIFSFCICQTSVLASLLYLIRFWISSTDGSCFSSSSGSFFVT